MSQDGLFWCWFKTWGEGAKEDQLVLAEKTSSGQARGQLSPGRLCRSP